MKFLLTAPLIFSLIAPPPQLLGDNDLLSPRSITKDENFVDLFQRTLSALEKNSSIPFRNEIATLLHRSLNTLKGEEETSIPSFKQKKLQLISVSEVVMATRDQTPELLRQALTNLEKNPCNRSAICQYMQLFLLTSNREGSSKEELIQRYLQYYSAVRNSNTPFDLEDLNPLVSPEDLRQYIEEHIKIKEGDKKLSYLQLEFLFAEMIRRLKLGKDYAGHTWPTSKKSKLHKTNIFNHIFSELLADWQNIPATEDTMRRLCILILFHLLKEKGITGFSLQEQNQFLNIATGGILYGEIDQNNPIFPGVPIALGGANIETATISTPYELNFKAADLRHVNLKGVQFYTHAFYDKADLRHSCFENVEISGFGHFSFASLSEANLKGLNLDSGGNFICTDLKGANLEKFTFEEDEGFTEFNFRGSDLRKAKLGKSKFDPRFFFFGIHEATGRKTIITESQYKKYFKNFDRALFQIEEDEPLVDADISAILLLFLLTGFDSNLLAVAATVGFFYALVKLATAAWAATSSAKMRHSGSGTAVRIFPGEVRPFQSPFLALEASL